VTHQGVVCAGTAGFLKALCQGNPKEDRAEIAHILEGERTAVLRVKNVETNLEFLVHAPQGQDRHAAGELGEGQLAYSEDVQLLEESPHELAGELGDDAGDELREGL